MITAIRNYNFTNFATPTKLGVSTPNNANKISNYMSDSVSFSGNAVAKLSDSSTELVQKFAKGLKLEHLYTIETPAERMKITSIKDPDAPSERSLFIHYSGYSKNNSGIYMKFSVNSAGEVYQEGEKLKETKDIALYEKILPSLIKKASKEFHMNIK